MKISELVKKTGVSKETIHYYIREGVLPKPKKTGSNQADYGADFVEQVRLIKALRENYFLPIPVIKKLMKKHNKQSPADRSAFMFLSEYIRPLDQLVSGGVTGRAAFIEATGISEKWLDKMEQWGIITSENRNGKPHYSQDDVIIGRLLVDMDGIGIGPRDGFDPAELRNFTDLFRDLVARNVQRFMELGWQQMARGELRKKSSQSTEIMSLFFYHIYRKMVKEQYRRYFQEIGEHRQDEENQ
ncbi:MAG: MerR family transcriptional regulator [Desulfosalsimonas sp.]|uniref:MerR family transcriptional regulator n=1 Tax=Desulfosalsimonas sp. TaxID=3073848 RepID=UPI003970F514